MSLQNPTSADAQVSKPISSISSSGLTSFGKMPPVPGPMFPRVLPMPLPSLRVAATTVSHHDTGSRGDQFQRCVQ